MQTEPIEGPLHPRWGPYVRNVQELAPGIWIADGCRGIKGLGRLWCPMIVVPNPNAGQPSWTNGPLAGPHTNVGVLKLVPNGYRRNMWKVTLYGTGISSPRLYIEAHFPNDRKSEALDFLIREAKNVNFS